MMSESPSQPANPSPSVPTPQSRPVDAPASVILVSYPKMVFLYPTFVASIVAALVMSFIENPLDPSNSVSVMTSMLFLGIVAVNIVILAFDFPRTTSLTLFFFAVALVLGFLLLVKFRPEVLPAMMNFLSAFHPLANATFYWTMAGVLGAIFLALLVVVRFDYWEVRPNELLHHHGFLSNMERLSAPHLTIDKEINDVFEYLLLRSGTLILQPSGERRAIVLDNVVGINRKEEAITRMLGALQVQVRPEGTEG